MRILGKHSFAIHSILNFIQPVQDENNFLTDDALSIPDTPAGEVKTSGSKTIEHLRPEIQITRDVI